MSKIWLITGAGRGMGVDIAKAALAAGYNVVTTGESNRLLPDQLMANAPRRTTNRVSGPPDLCCVGPDRFDPEVEPSGAVGIARYRAGRSGPGESKEWH